MAITTLAGLMTAKRQVISITSSASVGSGNTYPNSRFAAAGEPTGTLAGTSTAAGVVPTSGTAGYPYIRPFAAGNTGYLANVSASNSNSKVFLFDRLFVAGAYAFNASVNLASQPSFSARVPGGDYNGLEIWVENVTAGTGIQSVTVGYTNQDGTNGRSTGAMSYGGAGVVSNCFPMQLQSGDSGVQQIDSVTGTVATAGTFNVMVLRRLAEFRLPTAGSHDRVSPLDGWILPQIYSDSALYVMSVLDSGTGAGTGIVRVRCDIVEG